MWFLWVIAIIAAFGSSNFLFHGIQKRNAMLVYYGLSMFFLGLSGVALAIGGFGDGVALEIKTEWFIRFSNFSTQVILLCALAMLIRDIKPPFARFPIAFVNIPLILILAFPLALNTPIIIEWVQNILQIGALVIFTLIIIVLGNIYNFYYKLLLPNVLFLISFLLYHIDFEYDIDMIWQGSFVLGLFSFVFYYDKIINSEFLLFSEESPLNQTQRKEYESIK